MLSAFKRVVAAFLGLIAVVLAIGFFLPRGYLVEQSIEVAAPPETIYPLLNRLPNWQLWSVSWNPNKIDGLDVRHAEPFEGVGAKRTWREPRGEGELWITAAEPNQTIKYDSVFQRFPVMASEFRLQALPAVENQPRTRITWRSQGQLPSGPFYGWFAFVFQNALGQQYQRDLEQLKSVSEKEVNETAADPANKSTPAAAPPADAK